VPTVEAFGRRWRQREVTSLEITEACLGQIAKHNPRLNAFISVMADDARRQAEQADRELAAGLDRGPLHGVPVSLKDLIDVRGVPTTAASHVRDGHVASADAPIVTALRVAGAVLIGKTNLHEFAFGTTNEDSAFGPARHPMDPARSPGGSSGGSAIAVASGMSLAAIGTDTGGSIRIPAAACGIVGFKPPHGTVSTEGVVPLSTTLDHVGPLAASVHDAWLVQNALLGVSSGEAIPPAGDGAGLRVGLPRAYFLDVLQEGVRQRFNEAVETLQRAGVHVDEVTIPDAAHIAPVYLHMVLAEAASYHGPTLETVPDRYTPPVRLRLEMGRYVLAEDYVRAMAGRRALIHQVDMALAGRNALVLPTLPITAPPIGCGTVAIAGTAHPVRNLMLRLTQLFNVTGHPAISLPCGLADDNLPSGLQLIGRRGQTTTLLATALAVEALLLRATASDGSALPDR
jgi:aspartyl-tRNA(Asn)/glutamyl-tRNA(Gln) amidotransferase subunit A